MRQSVVLITLVWIFFTGTARAQQPDGSTRIGIIDVAAVYEKKDRFQYVRTRIQQEIRNYHNELQELAGREESYKKALQNPNLRDDERDEIRRSLIHLRRRFFCDQELEMRYQKVLEPLLEGIVAIDEDVTRKVSEFAVAEGFDLIVSRTQAPRIDALVPRELLQRRFRNRPQRPLIASGVSALNLTDVTEQFLKKENAP